MKRVDLSNSEESADKEKRSEVGILFVHGIGEQIRGETLRAVGEEVCTWLNIWMKRLPDWFGGDLKVAEVDIDPRKDTKPAQFLIDFQLRRRLEKDQVEHHQSRWLLAESHWADCYHPPPVTEVLPWMLVATPWVLISVANRLIRYHWQLLRQPKITRLTKLAAASRLLLVATMAFFVPLVALLFAAVFIVVLVLSIVPFAPWQRFLSRIQTTISSILGDSFVFTQNIVRQGAIKSKVLSDLQWLQSRCDQIFVVAHSQGAGVAFKVLQDSMPENLKGFFTVGSGLVKLLHLEPWRQDVAKSRFVVFFAAGLVYYAGAFIPFNFFDPDQPFLFALITLAIYGFALLASLFWLTDEDDVEQEIYELGDKLQERQAVWVDLFTARDPVSAGPMILSADERLPKKRYRPEDKSHLLTKSERIPCLQQHEVHNIGSWVYDHTSYWRNLEQVISRLCHVVTSEVEPTPGFFKGRSLRDHTSDLCFDDARISRQRRVLLNKAVEFLTLICGAIILLTPVSRETIARFTKNGLESVLNHASSYTELSEELTTAVSNWSGQVTGIYLVIGGYFVAIGLYRVFSRYDDRLSAIENMLEDGETSIVRLLVWTVWPTFLLIWLMYHFGIASQVNTLALFGMLLWGAVFATRLWAKQTFT